MTPDTPRRHFHDELDRLQDSLLEMAGIAERIVALAAEGVLTRDRTVSRKVIAEDDRVDELEVSIDELAVELLALQQPMARDLRLIIATLKVSNDLERAGDHGVNMARAAKRLAKLPPLPDLPEVAEMADMARGMLSDAMACFVARDTTRAREICLRDDRVDNLRESLFRILVTHMLEDPRRISPALELLLITQNLERIADLATNIAEDVVFLVEGRTIKHNVQDSDSEDEVAGEA
jgi:phosphate transport system protein